MKRQLGLSEMVRRRAARASRRALRGAFGWWAWSSEGDLRSSGRRGRETRAERDETRAERATGGRRSRRDRRGSTLLVVLAMLGMLMLLGMLYFTFSSQEQANATNFAEAAKRLDDPGDDIDAIFDAAIKQLIQGADYQQKNSVLWLGRHSLLGNMLGFGPNPAGGMIPFELQPFSGAGVNFIVSSGVGGGLAADQDRDGSADVPSGGYDLVELNDSPAARPNLFEREVWKMPAPDVDYTAPDLNNIFLCYDGYTWDFSTYPPTRIRVVKPSFHRPELFRVVDSTGWNPVTNWATASGAGGRSFRPHPEHLYVWRQNTTQPPQRRFISPAFPEPGLSSFPFDVNLDADTNVNEQGVFSRRPTEDANGNGMLDGGEDANGNGILDPAPGSFDQFEFDVDNDGDGDRDGIWMDLDLPVLIRPSDSATYIPLISFKVVDLASKLDLNANGNLSGDTRTSANSDFGVGFDIHHSSLGLSTWEVNPLWGLDTHPTEVSAATLVDHTSYFHAPTTQRHLANMEWWWLNKGRVEYTTPRQIYAGRYGEANRMWQVLSQSANAISVQSSNPNLFPFPGIWDLDDNRDANDGGPITLTGVLGGQSLAYQHPLPLNGLGRWWVANPLPNPKVLDLRSLSQIPEDTNGNGVLDPGEDFNGNGVLDASIGTGPVAFMRYTGMGVGDDGSGNGNVDWLQMINGSLMRNTVIGANFGNPSTGDYFDDPTELTLEPKYEQRPYDEPLEPKDSLLLYMSNSDRNLTNLTSRVSDLMPGNIPQTGATAQQLEVSKRFTTLNWDLKTFAMPRIPGVRDWEFNVDYDGNSLLEFPPEFTGGSGTERAFQADDPFRPQLRRLLTTELGNTNKIQHTFKLNINEFLDVEHRPSQATNPVTDALQYRPLTPHSTDDTLTTLPAVSPLPAYPPTTEGEKEFWARRDRQQMARDIYVMLYTFCGGNDRANVSSGTEDTNGNGVLDSGEDVNNNGVLDTGLGYLPSASVRRQMAQFAVNMVDALDRDNVITAFEYDNNLADGWNLDDDAYSVSAAESALPAGERGIVFGVEAQELTFSEVLWLCQQKSTTTDYVRTPFDETVGDYHFFQIELRSTSPKSVKLAETISTSTATGIWRIHRDDNNDGVIDATENAMTFSNGAGSVAAGSLFTIASADASSVGSASLYIDYTGTASTAMARHDELIAPNLTTGTIYTGTTLPPEANLDLLHPSHATRFQLSNGTAANGDFLSRNNNPVPGLAIDLTIRTNLKLDRRLNPKTPQLSLALNPYVTVDTFRGVRPRDLMVTDLMAQTDANDRLSMSGVFSTNDVQSRERSQPFDANNVANSTGSGSSVHLNSIGQNNTNSPGTTNLHQIHFDRDFASVVELINVPLRGPAEVTRIQRDSRRAPETAAGTPGPQQGQLERGGPFTFGAAIMMQSEDADEDSMLQNGEDANNNGVLDPGEDGTNGNPTDNFLQFGEDYNGNGVLDVPGTANHDAPNHFHRLLSLVEVPTRSHRQLGDPLKLTRVPGRLNLNGISDPRILGGLIDDRSVMDAPERDINGNGVLDPAEDLNNSGVFDFGLTDSNVDFSGTPAPELSNEPDSNGNGVLDLAEDLDGDGYFHIGRDWWFNFLVARDGLDPTSRLPLPIAGISTPFRDMGVLQPSQGSTTTKSSIGDTLLRPLPITNYGASGRRLFELGTENPTTPGSDEYLNGTVDPTLRHRLLSKVVNNSTTRGNCFVVFVTIGMFECVEKTDGSVRIGGQMDVDGDGQPDTHRAAFIIDRSTAEEAFDKASKTFDWKKLVLAKQRVN